jgi:DnaJ-class molecular chaperone
MERRQVTCGNCGGTGRFIGWKAVESNNQMLKWDEASIVCTQCNGTGYTEYAVFSIEEAEAILKHCGLSTES